MEKITPKFIREAVLPPGRSQIIYRDSELVGFGVRVTATCKSYIVEVRVQGKQQRRTIARCDVFSPSEARQRARKLLAEMTTGRLEEKPQTPTLQQALERYLAVRPLKEITQQRARYTLQKNLPEFLPLPVTSITKTMVEQKFQELSTAPTRLNTGGKGRANCTFRMLHTIIRFAIADFDLETVNPVAVLTNNKAWHRVYPRQGVVPDSQLPAWYKSVMGLKNKNHRDYFLLLIFTGFRRATAAQLTWSQVSFADRVIAIPPEASKSYREQRLPMSDFFYDLLKRRYDDRTSECVFPRRYVRNPKKYMSFVDQSHELVRREAGINITIHNLRRSFLTVADTLCAYNR